MTQPPGPARHQLRPVETLPVERESRELRRRPPQSTPPAPPIKPATWEWYIPIYFWLGGISAGAWLIAAAEDVAGEGDRAVIGTARYIAVGSLLGGTGLLIADLGRPDRFLNMLRIVRPRSAMSLGSWGLTAYGGVTAAGALLQAAEDGLLGRRSSLARMSRGWVGRGVHLGGLPLALFVGGYTGVLLASTSTPSWSRRTGTLGPLFLSSAVSSGVAAVATALELRGRLGPRVQRRLARAEAVALSAELLLALRGRAHVADLASTRAEPLSDRAARALTLGAGVALPLMLEGGFARGWGNGTGRRRKRRGRLALRQRPSRRKLGLVASGLALAGALALRFLTTREGIRSARTPADTWRATRPDEAEGIY